MIDKILLLPQIGGIYNVNQIADSHANFRGNSQFDTVEINSVGKYTTEKYLKEAVNNNPQIAKIIDKYNPDLELNMEDLLQLQSNHATDIKNVANSIIDNLPKSLQARVNKEAILDAAQLHDIGKVLIPSEILNKPDKLTPEEKEIMKKHSLLSYELLKNTDIDEYTLNLVKYHHQNANLTGYPKIDNNFTPDINLQILTVADAYSALTEKRPYKNTLSPKQALTIIYHEHVKTGNIHPFVFNALIKSINLNPVYKQGAVEV